ncbi:winged helix-turn-helix domain-containing protein [Nocardioides xinjiangensis]|uniref:winged helix-turn-helix domain-containing protein n=1 Tax=Nocardioides xinjiangensis TaxID=2817376 RepID=UPI001B303482|nr:crosslink repair DNA glycosylase YcaQ family protein [Nocardioides sp. SYSU D00778]
MDRLTALQARRIALAAQGFTDRPHATPSTRTFDRTLARTGVLQVDSVNVLQRAHYMPLYSRMGPYDTDLLRRAAERRPRRVVEYWAHVQALMPVGLWPLMRHRMDQYRAERGKWGFVADPTLEPRVLDAVRDRGPVTARDLEDEFSTGPRSREHWGWNWSEARKVLDYLFLVGDVAVAGRTSQFEVVYDLPERVLPTAVLDAPTPTPQDAVTELVRRAARSHGVASAPDLADYYRLRLQPAPGRPSAKVAIDQLVESGELVPVAVDGWRRQAYLHRDARLPRRVSARTLLSPFDPLVWERARTEALFGFHYRIEIYVPAPKRRHGYYVLPFLLGDRLVARVDLKADRASRSLLVPAAFAEAGAPPGTAEELAEELRRLSGWLGLDDVVVGDRGDLSAGLSHALGSPLAR